MIQAKPGYVQSNVVGRLAICTSLLLGCNLGAAPATPDAGSEGGSAGLDAVCGPQLDGVRVDIEFEGNTLAEVGPAGSSEVCARGDGLDARELWIVPAFIDSHVHLDYYRVADELPARGIVAAVDLAVPLDAMPSGDGRLHQLVSGPMLTAPQGYPTQTWGVGGYGLELSTPQEGVAAVTQLIEAGAGVIKIPFTGTALLDDATVLAIVEAAHEQDRLVAAHAMEDAQVLRAAQLGADILAHTPTQPMSPESLDAWAERSVITTLAAFGTDSDAQVNLAAMKARGTRILYGTDLGNSREVGISPSEIEALLLVGLTPAEIIEAATSVPAALWKWTALGRIEEGAEASFLLLTSDPLADPLALASPAHVVIAGEWLEPPKDVPTLPNVGGP